MKRKLLAYVSLICVMFMLIGTCSASAMNAVVVGDTEATEEVTTEEEVTTSQNRFLVQIQYGIDSLVKYGTRLPVQVTVTNQGADFTGEVRLMMDFDYAIDQAYGKEISIPAGGTKTVSLAVPYDGSGSACYVYILDDKEKIQYQKKINHASLNDDGSVVVGILSDDFASLNWLDGQDFALTNQKGSYEISGLMKCGKLDENNLPDITSSLCTCAIIVIDNFDTSKLSDAQYQTLKEWVKMGGILILGTGSEHNKVLAKFQDDFVTGKVGSLNKKTVTLRGQGTTEVSEDETVSNDETTSTEEKTDLEVSDTLTVDVLDLDIDGAKEINEISDETLFSYKHYGQGTVMVSHIALGMEPFVSYANNMQVLEKTVDVAASENSKLCLSSGYVYGNATTFNVYESAVDAAGKVKVPNPAKYLLLFLIYIVLVGPGLYLILKWKEKRTALWLAIPCVALLCTGVVFLLSLGDTIRQNMINAMVIEAYHDGGKTEHAFFASVSPKSKAYTVSLADGFSNVRPMNDYMYNSGFAEMNTNQMCVIREKSNSADIVMPAGQAFSSYYFKANRTVTTEETIDADIYVTRNGLTGEVRNLTSTNLSHVIVYYGGLFSYIDKIPAGESVSLTARHSLAVADWYDVTYQVFPQGYSKTNKAEWNRLDTLTSVLRDRSYSNQDGEYVMVAAYRDDAQVQVASDDIVQYANVIAYWEVPYQVSADTGFFVRNIHTKYLVSESNDWDPLYGTIYSTNEIIAEYDFGVDDVRVLYNEGPQYTHQTEASCFIYNPQNGEWEPMFVGEDSFDITAYYHLDSKYIMVKYVIDNTTGENAVPIISGGEK